MDLKPCDRIAWAYRFEDRAFDRALVGESRSTVHGSIRLAFLALKIVEAIVAGQLQFAGPPHAGCLP
jgi:hypothetical protein